MTIDLDVQQAAHHFGLDPALIQAVVNAEGGGSAILKAVRCSMPEVTTRDQALDVLCRSCVHAMRDFVHTSGLDKGFVGFWAARWAPVGAANDPHDSNRNWPGNVFSLWRA